MLGTENAWFHGTSNSVSSWWRHENIFKDDINELIDVSERFHFKHETELNSTIDFKISWLIFTTSSLH